MLYNILLKFFQEIGEESAILFHKTLPSRKAIYEILDPPLPWKLQEILYKGHVTDFYSHQVQAINAIKERKNIVITTGTASGKSLCYNLPVIEAIMTDTSTRALYVFPTKSLAHSQLSRLQKYKYAFYYDDFHYGIYDGDTPKEERYHIRKKSNILITTPDMLHLGILPNHNLWKDFFGNLKYVILDELHTYRGIFGSHMAQVIRRLKRICSNYNTAPTFVCSSGTIKNPLELASSLVEEDFEIIKNDGSPVGEKIFVFWDSEHKKNFERSINTETSLLFYHLISSGIRTIVFTKTRIGAEIILKTTKDLLSGTHQSLIDRITSYTAGYIPEYRRKIEKQLATGELIGIVTTSALEAGIDIGALEACIIVGFPKDIMSLWQQAGRVGRRDRESMVVVIASQSPKDQYYLTHGNDIFSLSYEDAIIDVNNPYILDGHFRCAAYELPFASGDELYFGEPLFPFIRAYNEKNYLFYKNNKFEWNIEEDYPAQEFSLRNSCDDLYEIIDSSPPANILETLSGRKAKFYLPVNAIYVHNGETYKVIDIDNVKRKIYVVPDPVEYYTVPQIISEGEPGRIIERYSPEKELFMGYVNIIEKCQSYREIELYTGRFIKTVPIDERLNKITSTGLWFTLSESIQKKLLNSDCDMSGGLHGAGYALTSILPVFVLCDTGEIGSIISSFHPATGKPTIFIYDRFPGGIGYAVKGYRIFNKLINETCNLIKNCRCEKGCVKCIYSPYNIYPEKYLTKKAVFIILNSLKEEYQID